MFRLFSKLFLIGLLTRQVDCFDGWIHDVLDNKKAYFKSTDCGIKEENGLLLANSGTFIPRDYKKNDSTFANERRLLSNSTQIKQTPFALLEASIVSSFMLILFTEFGDRTFLLAALLALKSSKLIVFSATSSALVIQTAISTITGQLLHYIPSNSKLFPKFFSLPLDDYGAAVLLFIFGIIHLKAACVQNDKSVDTDHSETVSNTLCIEDEMKDQQFSGCSSMHISDTTKSSKNASSFEDLMSHKNNSPYFELSESDIKYSSKKIDNFEISKNIPDWSAETLQEQMVVSSENSQRSEQIEYSLQYIFWAIFVAEFGDKSMFSSIALATSQNPYGVFIGSSSAHILITTVAVSAGKFFEGIISERLMNTLGAILFLGSAVLTTFEGLARQGIHLWWILADSFSLIFVQLFVTFRKTLASFFHS